MPRRNTRTKKRTLKKRSRKQRGGGGDDPNGGNAAVNGIRRVNGNGAPTIPTPPPAPPAIPAPPAEGGAGTRAYDPTIPTGRGTKINRPPTAENRFRQITEIASLAGFAPNLEPTAHISRAMRMPQNRQQFTTARFDAHLGPLNPRTPLMDAAMHGNVEAVRQLFPEGYGYGIDIEEKSYNPDPSKQRTAMEFARKLLQELENNPEAKNRASRIGDAHEIIRILSANGALYEIRGVAGHLDLALRKAMANTEANIKLDLSENYIDAAGARELAAELPHLTALQSLDLRMNELGAAGARDLAAAFPHLTALKSLNLAYNNIGAAGARDLAAKLPHLTELQSLNLDLNDIGAEGARALAAALPHLTALKSLNLDGNNISAEGAHALAAALPRLTSLKLLDVESNELGAEGARALADALPRSLQTLNLPWNNIGDAGAQALAAALPSSLQSLNLAHNDIGEAGARALAAKLPDLRALKLLNLEANVIGSEVKAAIRAAAPPTCKITFARLR